MRVSAKADYAVRAAVELAAAGEGEPVKGERLATSQDIPLQFLEHILLELKHQGLVRARRGAKGGYWLARPAAEVTVADVVRAVEGPIANVQSMPPETIEYAGNVDFGLAGNILVGSIPGVIIGAALSDRAPQGLIRIALGIVLMASGIVTIQKGDSTVWPIAAGVAALLLGAVLYAPHYLNRRYLREKQRLEAAAEAAGQTSQSAA